MEIEKNVIEIAKNILEMTEEELMNNVTYEEEIDAYYFWQPFRGGYHLIINKKGEKLALPSGISPSECIKHFESGKRN